MHSDTFVESVTNKNKFDFFLKRKLCMQREQLEVEYNILYGF